MKQFSWYIIPISVVHQNQVLLWVVKKTAASQTLISELKLGNSVSLTKSTMVACQI